MYFLIRMKSKMVSTKEVTTEYIAFPIGITG